MRKLWAVILRETSDRRQLLLLDGPAPKTWTWISLHLAFSLSVLILIAGHLIALALRLRGRWTLLDLGGALVTGLILAAVLRRAREAMLIGDLYFLPIFLAQVVLVAFLVGVFMQLWRGGALRGRLHATGLSSLWSTCNATGGFQSVRWDGESPIQLSPAPEWSGKAATSKPRRWSLSGNRGRSVADFACWISMPTETVWSPWASVPMTATFGR